MHPDAIKDFSYDTLNRLELLNGDNENIAWAGAIVAISDLSINLTTKTASISYLYRQYLSKADAYVGSGQTNGKIIG